MSPELDYRLTSEEKIIIGELLVREAMRLNELGNKQEEIKKLFNIQMKIVILK